MEQGETISADNSDIFEKLGGGVLSYQWQRNGVDIPGATGPDYLLVREDVGAAIRVVTTHVDASGVVETFVSAETDPIAPNPEFADAPAPEPAGATAAQFAFDDRLLPEAPPAPKTQLRPGGRAAAPAVMRAAAPRGRKKFLPKTFTITPEQIAALETRAREAYLAGDLKRPDVSRVLRAILDDALGTASGD